MPGHTSRQLACVCAIVNFGLCTTQQTNIDSIQRGARNDPAFLKEARLSCKKDQKSSDPSFQGAAY